MIAAIFKRVEIFQPYNVPIQPLIIAQTEKIEKTEKNAKNLVSMKSSPNAEFSNEEEHPQNDSTSCSGELDKFTENYWKWVLQDAWKISHEKAMEKAEKEYREYQAKTLSPVEIDYLNSIKEIQKRIEKTWNNKI